MRSLMKLATCALFSLASATIYEAELATRAGGLYVDTAVSGFTGTGYVTNFTGTAELLTFSITGLAAGKYNVSLVYSAPYGSKFTDVSVNGAASIQASMPNVTTAVWATSLVGSFTLPAGPTTISLDDGWGWYLLDSVILVPTPVAPVVSVDVTSGATAQAENGIFSGSVTAATSTAGFSGTGYAQGFFAAGDMVTITVFSQTTAIYNLVVGYAAIYGAKQTTMSLNGGGGSEVVLADTSTAASPWATASGGQVLLNAGNNTISFIDDWGWYFIDYIKLTPAPAPPAHQVTTSLVNPNALPVTYALYNTLLAKYGSGKIFSGQAGTDGVAWIQSNLGKTPAIIGLDMIDYSPSRVLYQGNIATTVEDAIAFDATGGIVAFQWHWNAPADLVNNDTVPWWMGIYSYGTTFNLTAALANPAGSDYALLLSDMDAIAFQLRRLQTAGIPILWRPLHEAEGGWFWWGAYGPESAKALYRLMYNRFTTYHGLNNLIWVWNSVQASWYPGADVVDILGYDSYPAAGDHGPVSAQYQALITLGLDKKMVTLPEVGNIPDPDILKLYHADWSYFVTWNQDYILTDTWNTLAFKQKVYNDPTVLKLTDLGNWKGAKTSSSSKVSSSTKVSSSSSSRVATLTTTTSTVKPSSSTKVSSSSSSIKTTSSNSNKILSSSKISSSTKPSIIVTSTTSSAVLTSTFAPAPRYGQCGGWPGTFLGPFTCQSPWVCTYNSPYYSQCL